MNRLVAHIEHLLILHNYVVVPSFGTFVFSEVSSHFCDKTNSFSPICQELSFHPNIQRSDVLLVLTYMQRFRLTYDKALKLMEKDVASLKNEIKKHQTFPLGTLGIFKKKTKTEYQFIANNAPKRQAMHFMLPTLHLLKAAELLQSKTLITPDGSISNKKKNWISAVRDLFYPSPETGSDS